VWVSGRLGLRRRLSPAEIGSEWSLGDAEQYTKWQGSV
jgi:hypothetical protein